MLRKICKFICRYAIFVFTMSNLGRFIGRTIELIDGLSFRISGFNFATIEHSTDITLSASYTKATNYDTNLLKLHWVYPNCFAKWSYDLLRNLIRLGLDPVVSSR